MTATTTTAEVCRRGQEMTKDERFVVVASSLGTVFEWYDFYLYESLAAIIGAQHTAGAAAFIFVLNFLVLGTNLQTALIWAIGFGTFAFVLARQHTQR